jgi:hypothetical protein
MKAIQNHCGYKTEMLKVKSLSGLETWMTIKDKYYVRP